VVQRKIWLLVLVTSLKDGTKESVLDVVQQYAENVNAPFQRPHFRAYDKDNLCFKGRFLEDKKRKKIER
jgi:hypothetical protein